MKKFQHLKSVLLLVMLAASMQLWAQTPQQITFAWEASGAKVFIFNADQDKDITVNWGDGTSNVYKGKGTVPGKNSEIECSHTYGASGTYQVSVKATDGNIGIISIQNQKVVSLDVSGCDNLKRLQTGHNQLSSLDLSKNAKLEYVECFNNRLSYLDVSRHQALKSLRCYNNQLTSLNVSDNPNLTHLLFQNNQVSDLNLTSCKALLQLICYENQLTGLDVTNCTSLTDLKCNSNKLTSLDLSKNIALTHLECQHNYLLLSDLYRYSNPNLQYNLKTPHVLPTQDTHVNAVIDLSKETLFDGIATTFKVLKNQGPEIAAINVDYTLSQGKLVFKTPGEYSVEMTNTAIVSSNFAVCSVRISYLVTEAPVTATERLTFTWEATAGVEKDFGLSADKSITIDWGDGTSSDYIPSSEPAHTYSKSGTYQVSVKCTSSEGKILRLNVSERNIILLDVGNAASLNTLSCYQNRITHLDLSKNTRLGSIFCHKNLLTHLDISKNTNLTDLECSFNQIVGLTTINNLNLEILGCRDNLLTNLDVSKNLALTLLSCDNNQLSALGVTRNVKLISLLCQDNKLTSLDISKNLALMSLSCDNNQLSALDLTRNVELTYLTCSSNKLTRLDISKHINLETLTCSRNRLTQLDVSKNKDLTVIYCNDNALTVLDVRNNLKLERLYCRYNQLTYLDLRKHSKLYDFKCDYNSITALDINMDAKFTFFSCSYNQLTNLDIPSDIPHLICADNTLPLSKLYPFSKQSNKTREIGFQQLPDITLPVNSEIDLSGESVFDGVATDFKIEKGVALAIINTDYTLTGGKLRFIRPGQYHVAMSNNVIRSKLPDNSSEIATVNFSVYVTGTKSALLADQAYTGSETVTVYPNPTSGLVYVNSNREEQPRVKVYDATGNLLLQVQQSEVDLSDYPNGLYLFQVGSQTVKVIKH